MRSLYILTLFLLYNYATSADNVVLVHGLLQTPQSLARIKITLEHEGYTVHYFSYPSASDSIQINADSLYRFIEKNGHIDGKIHLVGHSLGGVIICEMLSKYHIDDLGRIVLIASPLKGSSKADFYEKYSILRKLYGPALTQLADENLEKDYEKLVNDSTEIGMIVGYIGMWPDNPIVTGKDDGVVAVDETSAPFLKDEVMIRGQHTLILFRAETARQVVSFLKTGHFKH